jgi:toxin FitB
MGSDWYDFPMEAVVDQAGRIVLPKFIRDALGLLPGAKVARLSGQDAARLLDARFVTPLMLTGPRARKVHATFSRLGIAGGAVYDGLVALAAKEHGVALATRDARARGTYDAVGRTVILVA